MPSFIALRAFAVYDGVSLLYLSCLYTERNTMRFSFLIVLGLTQLVPQTAWSEERMNVWKLDVHFSVRTERFRLIRYGSGAEELYNSKIDPHEWTNEISNPDFDSDHKRLVSLLPEAAKAVRYRKRNKK